MIHFIAWRCYILFCLSPLAATLRRRGLFEDQQQNFSGEWAEENLKDGVPESSLLQSSTQIKSKAYTAIEPVTVGALLALAVVGDLANVAITKVRIHETRQSLKILRDTSEQLLDERADVCVSARAFAFQSGVLAAQTQVFMHAASAILPRSTWVEVAKGEDPAQNLLTVHKQLVQQQRRHSTVSVQQLCLHQDGHADRRQLEKELKVASEVQRLQGKLMEDWTNVMFEVFDYTLFDPTFAAALPTQGAGLLASNIITGGGMEGILALYDDQTFKDLNEMTLNGTAPLWILRILNGVSHFLDSGIMKTQTHLEVITYAVRAGIITTHGLITGSLKAAIKSKSPHERLKLFFSVADSTFWLIRDVYRVIYGAGQVVPWPIVSIFAILKNIRVALDISENSYGLYRQRTEHQMLIDMSTVETNQLRLQYRFSACVSFLQAEMSSRKQQEILSTFESMLEALPSQGLSSYNSQQSTSGFNIRRIIMDVFAWAPQFCYHALWGPNSVDAQRLRSGDAKATQENIAFDLLPRLLNQTRAASVRNAALWGPITDLAVSEDVRHDEAYEALGFFQPVPGWRLWACRGCSEQRILYAEVCHGDAIVACLQNAELQAKQRFNTNLEDGPSVHVFALPAAETQRDALGDYAQLYRLEGVRPRLFFVSELAQAVAAGTPVLTELHWMRITKRVPARLQLVHYRSPSVEYLNMVSRHNSRVTRHQLYGRVMQSDVKNAASQLSLGASNQTLTPQSSIRVDTLWESSGVFDTDRRESGTKQLRTHDPKKIFTLSSGELLYAIDVGTASFMSEPLASGSGSNAQPQRFFSRLLLTEGHACHLYSSLRLNPGIRRVRTPAKLMDISDVLEGWLIDDSLWKSKHGATAQNVSGMPSCTGFTETIQHALSDEASKSIPTNLKPPWARLYKKLPVMRCSVVGVINLAAGIYSSGSCSEKTSAPDLVAARQVEDVLICDEQCPPAPAKANASYAKWIFLGRWKRAKKHVEVWIREAATKSQISNRVSQKQRAHMHNVSHENLIKASKALQGRLSNFRTVLANALCSEDQCHFRQTSKLEGLLDLKQGPKTIPDYMTAWGAEAYAIGPSKHENVSFEGLPQLIFARRRRGEICDTANRFLRSWASEHRMNLTTLRAFFNQDVMSRPLLGSVEGQVQVERKSVGVVRAPMFLTGGIALHRDNKTAWWDAAGEVRRSGVLKTCITNSSSQPGATKRANDAHNGLEIRTFAEAIQVAAGGTETECGFELIVPIVPEVNCLERDGLGLQVTTDPDGAVEEVCVPLASQPPVDHYLVWLSLRKLGRDEVGNLRRTGRELEHALITQWGFTLHAPQDRQPHGCLMPTGDPDVDTQENLSLDEQVGTRYVFRQEIWSRLDPRLSEKAFGTSQDAMCKLRDSIENQPIGVDSIEG